MAIHLTENDLFAVYSLPGEVDYTLIKQDDKNYLSLDKFECLPEQSGFIIHPFQLSEVPSIVVLSDIIEENIKFTFSSNSLCTHSETSYDAYKDAFISTQNAIDSNEISKLVLSRIKKANPLDSVYAYFTDLVKRYPKAFVFFYNIPEIGAWVGASPETLLSEKSGRASTMALAGTKRIDANREWTQKEKEEQRLVECFFEAGLENSGIFFEKKGPETSQAGAIAHIKTEYSFSTEGRFLELADLFHPSPAISGSPQQKSIELINSIEEHNRKYYCGYLGPYNIKGEKSLFINLRSMEIFKDASLLYLGGGLTKESELKAEWNETENKAETLSSIIQKT